MFIFKLALLGIFLMPYLGCISYNSKNVHSLSYHGTIIFAGVSKQHIILAADSRLSFYHQDPLIGTQSYFAYLDNVNKVFPLSKYVMSFAGKPGTDKYSFDQIVEHFVSSNVQYTSPLNCIETFGDFVKANYPIYMEDFLKGQVFCVGFVNDTGHLATMKDSKIRVYHGYVATDNFDATRYTFDITTTELMKMAIDGIDKYKELRPFDVGGPISVVRIDKENNVVFLQNDFTNNKRGDSGSFLDSYFRGELNIKYFNEESKKVADSLFRYEYTNWCK